MGSIASRISWAVMPPEYRGEAERTVLVRAGSARSAEQLAQRQHEPRQKIARQRFLAAEDARGSAPRHMNRLMLRIHHPDLTGSRREVFDHLVLHLDPA